MNYLSASEIAKEWKISSRMVAYYCETERIAGAVKKGKTWLIPVDAKKPMDKRKSKEKRKMEIPYMQVEEMKQADREGLNDSYHTSEVLENLGLSREALRYYEEIGLIQPKRSKYSQYREFDFFDVSRLLAIDFYKKRGFSTSNIKELFQQKEPLQYVEQMAQQIENLEDAIADIRTRLQRLQETKAFFQEALKKQGLFTIREIPLYQVQETMDSVLSLGEYKEKVIQSLNLDSEDILSNMVRTISFDENGYTGSQMCIVKKVEETKEDGIFLETGKCAHVILEADNDDNSIMEKMFVKAYEWAAEQQISFCGTAYIFIRFVTMEEQKLRNFYEIWIPIKE